MCINCLEFLVFDYRAAVKKTNGIFFSLQNDHTGRPPLGLYLKPMFDAEKKDREIRNAFIKVINIVLGQIPAMIVSNLLSL